MVLSQIFVRCGEGEAMQDSISMAEVPLLCLVTDCLRAQSLWQVTLHIIVACIAEGFCSSMFQQWYYIDRSCVLGVL